MRKITLSKDIEKLILQKYELGENLTKISLDLGIGRKIKLNQ